MTKLILEIDCDEDWRCKYDEPHLHGFACDRGCPCDRGRMVMPVPAARHMGLHNTGARTPFRDWVVRRLLGGRK